MVEVKYKSFGSVRGFDMAQTISLIYTGLYSYSSVRLRLCNRL